MNRSKYTSKEMLFVIASLSCMILFICISSFANAGLDITKIFCSENLSNAILNAAITIFGTVAALPAGMVATKQRKNSDGSDGRYIQEFNEYNRTRSLIEPKRIAFSQWHTEQHRKELHQKRVEYLLSKGVLQAEDVLKLNTEQVKALTTSQPVKVDGEEVYFKALTEPQIEAVLHVLSGKVVVHKLPDFYFLYVDGKSSKTFYDQAYYEAMDESLTLTGKLLSKIFIGFAITCILTGLVITKNTEELSNAEFIIRAIILTLARIFNAVTSSLWGWLIGQELVYKQCYYINGRTQFLNLFNSDVNFKSKDIQELAKEDFEFQKGVEISVTDETNEVED